MRVAHERGRKRTRTALRGGRGGGEDHRRQGVGGVGFPDGRKVRLLDDDESISSSFFAISQDDDTTRFFSSWNRLIDDDARTPIVVVVVPVAYQQSSDEMIPLATGTLRFLA